MVSSNHIDCIKKGKNCVISSIRLFSSWNCQPDEILTLYNVQLNDTESQRNRRFHTTNDMFSLFFALKIFYLPLAKNQFPCIFFCFIVFLVFFINSLLFWSFQLKLGVDVAHPGISNDFNDEDAKKYYTYYQWVCFVLFFQVRASIFFQEYWMRFFYNILLLKIVFL